MKKRRRISGFTMAELLIVVAIIGVLSGVSFVAVQTHQRSMTVMDHNAIAKELYVAAQNHLTMAETQGYMDATDFGTEDSSVSGVYYYLVGNGGSNYSVDGNTVLDQMLPFGSIDETVRGGGNYLIRYRVNPARVLDVYYWQPDGKYGGTLNYDDIKSATSGAFGKIEAIGRVVVGWYGSNSDGGGGQVLSDDEIASEPEVQFLSPRIEVENAERLKITVSYPSDGDHSDHMEMKLIVTGIDADGAVTGMISIPLIKDDAPVSRDDGSNYSARVSNNDDDAFTIILDDITAPSLHFADLPETESIEKKGSILPGQNIIVRAVVYDNTIFANPAYSNEWITNSLFADMAIDKTDDTQTNAIITNIRHLENLDEDVSGMDNADNKWFDKAIQTVDLSWSGSAGTAFTTKIKDARIYNSDGDAVTEAGCFLPVSPQGYSLVYESNLQAAAGDTPSRYHSITGVVVNGGEAGLFGAPTMPLTVSNLELIDFRVTATGNGNAGALAANLPAGSSITNVLAHNSDAGTAATVASADGSAGVRGFVTDAMRSGEYVCACGPEPMLKAVHALASGGQFSFEARMGCGFGACMGCSCQTISGPKRICKEGPVLMYGDIIW